MKIMLSIPEDELYFIRELCKEERLPYKTKDGETRMDMWHVYTVNTPDDLAKLLSLFHSPYRISGLHIYADPLTHGYYRGEF